MDITLEHKLARPPISRASRAESEPRYRIGWARSAAEIEEVQRLRFEVFAGELGAQLTPAFDRAGHRLDRDERDAIADHLVVRDREDRVVGTYRLLAQAGGKDPTGGAFAMRGLENLGDGLVELGRACVHPEHRRGPVVMLLWKGIADFLRDGGHAYAFGCASVGMGDGGRLAASIHHSLIEAGRTSKLLTMLPHRPLPIESLERLDTVDAPVLVRAYIKIGARLCGPPAWDPEFNTADLPMLLSLADVDDRYRARFLTG
ncbi:GNAT family N-acetyltransferase [soil metagenome]